MKGSWRQRATVTGGEGKVSGHIASSQPKVDSGEGPKSGLKIQADDQTEEFQIQ